MMRWGEALILARTRLEAAGVASARLDSRLLLAETLGLDPHVLFAYPEKEMTPAQEEAFAEFLKRRAAREPVSHILGRREFWSLPFIVTNAVLDPRPDTETLIEAVLEQIPDREKPLRILDLGTGSGCILLTLLSEYPSAKGVGVDISEAALKIAKKNASHLELDGRADFIHGRWTENIEGAFDVIVSNPPYIPDGEIDNLEPEVALFEPRLALSGGVDGLDCYRLLAPGVFSLLVPGGVAAFEIGIGQSKDVEDLLIKAGLQPLPAKRDLSAVIRVVMAIRNE